MEKSNETLAAFGQCARTLIDLLHANPPLEAVEQMFIESHLALVRTAFDGWKSRNTASRK